MWDVRYEMCDEVFRVYMQLPQLNPRLARPHLSPVSPHTLCASRLPHPRQRRLNLRMELIEGLQALGFHRLDMLG
jgi:hypothetical protein